MAGDHLAAVIEDHESTARRALIHSTDHMGHDSPPDRVDEFASPSTGDTILPPGDTMRAIHAIIIPVVAASLACSTSSATRAPEVSEQGKYRVWYEGPEVEVEVDYWWAERHLGDQWMILEVAVAGVSRVAEVSRDSIRLRAPDGTSIPALDRTEFREVYGALRMAFVQTDAWAGPPVRFMGSRQPCGRWFYVAPGVLDHGYDAVYATPMQVCAGPLVFQVPIGVQPGRWVLTIDLEESDVRIPFVLGESMRP
jgi:hypothetical protein